MSGFSLYNSNALTQVYFAEAPEGEPVFVFLRDDGSDGKSWVTIVTATLDWVREQFYDFLHDDKETAVDYLEAYILMEGTQGLQRCELGTTAGENPGDGPRLMVSNNVGVLALYDI